MTEWYVWLGHLDRYFEIIQNTDLSSSTWTDADWLFYRGTVSRHNGFTTHPKYLEIAQSIGMIDVWEQCGAPDLCHKLGSTWACE